MAAGAAGFFGFDDFFLLEGDFFFAEVVFFLAGGELISDCANTEVANIVVIINAVTAHLVFIEIIVPHLTKADIRKL
jgi:hypothetical protein